MLKIPLCFFLNVCTSDTGQWTPISCTKKRCFYIGSTITVVDVNYAAIVVLEENRFQTR